MELTHLSATTTPDDAEDDSWFFESEERIATQLDEEAEQYEQVLQLLMSPHPPELPVIEGNAEREAADAEFSQGHYGRIPGQHLDSDRASRTQRHSGIERTFSTGQGSKRPAETNANVAAEGMTLSLIHI